jgi:hypothetical protein
LAIILSGGLLLSCGPSPEEQAATAAALTAAAATNTPTPTSTPSPTPTHTPTPTPTPTNTPEPPTATECLGDLFLYGFRDYTEDIGEIDGREYSLNAEALDGAYVDITARVVEAQHLVVDEAGVDGTLLLVVIPGDDGHLYPATVFLPDKGFGQYQFLPDSEITASGVHLGYFSPPENFFSSYPEIGLQGYEGAFASMMTVSAHSGC